LEAATYVLDQGMSFAEVGKRLGVLPKLVRDWVVKYEKGELVAGAPKLRKRLAKSSCRLELG